MSETLLSITMRSLYISSVAAFAAFAVAIALSFHLSRKSKRVVELVTGFFEALIGVPTTAVGLVIYMLLSPKGPLGFLKLLYTPYAIILGEFVVALPVAFVTMVKSVYSVGEYVKELVVSLGGSGKHVTMFIVRELTPTLLSSYLTAFSRAIGELGVALVVGGGIEGYTNVLTTAIAIQTSIGNYEYAIQLGLVLIAITVAIVLSLKLLGEYILWR